MKLIDLTCTKCGASMQVDGEREFCFCQYCGNKMLIDKDVTRIVDEAKIREAQAMENIKIAEANANMQKEIQSSKTSSIMFIIAAIVLIVSLCLKYLQG